MLSCLTTIVQCTVGMYSRELASTLSLGSSRHLDAEKQVHFSLFHKCYVFVEMGNYRSLLYEVNGLKEKRCMAGKNFPSLSVPACCVILCRYSESSAGRNRSPLILLAVSVNTPFALIQLQARTEFIVSSSV